MLLSTSSLLSCFLTSVLWAGPLCVWQLGFERRLVAMATKMGPVERNPVAVVVWASAWFSVAVLGGVLRVVISAAGVHVLLRWLAAQWSWVILRVSGTQFDGKALFVLASRLQNPRRNTWTHANICEGQLDVFFKAELPGLSSWQRGRCLDAIHIIAADSGRQRRPFLVPQTTVPTFESILQLVIRQITSIIQLGWGDGELCETPQFTVHVIKVNHSDVICWRDWCFVKVVEAYVDVLLCWFWDMLHWWVSYPTKLSRLKKIRLLWKVLKCPTESKTTETRYAK